MASAFELLEQAQPAEPQAPAASSPFQSGLRSGWAGLQGQLAAATGLGAERLGLDAVAQERYARSQQLQQEAAAEAANVPTWRDVGDAEGLRGKFGKAVDYVAGTAGELLPTLGAAGLGAGAAYLTRGAISPRLGAIGGVGVPEFGGMAERQQADPVARDATPRDRFNAAAGAAIPAAVLQTEVPGAIAERVAAPVKGTAARIAARGVGDAAAFGATSAGAEAVRQLGDQAVNPDKPFDTHAVEEAGLEGLAAGVPLAGAGVGAQLAKKALTAPGRAVSDAVSKAKDAVKDHVEGADPVQALRDAASGAKDSTSDFMAHVAQGADPASFKEYAARGADWVKANLPKIDEETQARVRSAGEELLNKAGISPEVRERVSQALSNVADKANQATIAAAKLGADTVDGVKAKAAAAMEAFRKGADVEDAAVKTKKSEDFSGAHAVIARELEPVLGKLDAETTNKAAEAVRVALDTYEKGGKSAVNSDQVFRLLDLFGDKAVDVLDASYRALGKVEPEERARLYDALNEFRAQKSAHDRTLDLMARSLDKDQQDVVKMPQLRRELDALRQWVRDNAERKDDPEGKFRGEQVREILAERYGKNADRILDAVQKEYDREAKGGVLQNAREGADLGGEVAPQHMVEHEFAGADFYGRESHGGDVTSLLPEHSQDAAKNQITSALERAQKQNPDKSVSVIKAKELGEQHPVVQKSINVRAKEIREELLKAGHSAEEPALSEKAMATARDEVMNKHGIVAVESAGDEPGTITRKNIREVMVKEKPGAATPEGFYKPENGALKVGNVHYDAPRLTEMMRRQFRDEHAAADKTALHRTGRLFMDGVAALSDHLGKPLGEIPDNLKIDRKGTTWGQVKGLDYTPEMKGEGGSDRVTSAHLEQQLKNLRNDYRRLKAAGAKESTLERMAEFGEKLAARIEEVKASEKREEQLQKDGKYEADPHGQLHEALNGREEAPLGTSHEGEPNKTVGKLNDLRTRAVDAIAKADAAPVKAVLGRLVKLIDNAHVLNAAGVKRLVELAGQRDLKPSQISSLVDAMYAKYEGKFSKAKDLPEPKGKPQAKTESAKAFTTDEMREMLTKESYGAVDSPEKADAFLRDAQAMYERLEKQRKRVVDDDDKYDAWLNEHGKVYDRLDALFGKRSNADLASFYDDGRTDAQVRAALKEGAASGAPKEQGPATGRRSEEKVNPAGRLSPDEVKAVNEHLSKVLGDSVLVEFKNILHAGEFDVKDGEHVIGISVHALNPVTTAYHESLHSFIQRLREMGHREAVAALEHLSKNEHVMRQLRELLKSEPEAIKQLSDPEEVAAYAYQFWAAGKLTVGPAAKTFFQRVKDAIAKALGIWTKDERAERILQYFHSGEFKRDMGAPDAVGRALIEAGRNETLEKAKAMVKPLRDLGEALAVAGGQRLRDTNVPALAELADRMKLRTTAEGRDTGFIPSARASHLRFMNELAENLRGVDPKHLDEAVEAMQRGDRATSPEARLVQRFVQDKYLPKMLDYMRKAGVRVNELGVDGPKYFPRVWDTSFISHHQAEFLHMLEKYELAGNLEKGGAKRIMQGLMAREGAEFNVETTMPGMQHAKQRVLSFIDGKDAAPFLRKNLWETLNSYTLQAARRAEWAKRFGDDGKELAGLLERAEKQGATPAQLEAARKYVKAVDGTLGDTIDPTTRRLIGHALVYQNVRLLPLAIFSSVVDPLGIVVRGGTVGDAWKTFQRGVREIRHNIKPGDADEATKIAQLVGTIDDAMLQHTVGASYSQGMVGDTGRKINDLFFRFNLMEQFNRSMRVGATQAAISFLERHADGTASKHSARWMRELGFEPGELKTEGGIDLKDERVRAAINRWVDGAVLRPDAADKPLWMSDPRWALVAHLKQFTYSFHETILKRVGHELDHGNLAPAVALASYVPVMIASDAAKGLIQGAGSQPSWKQDWGPEEYIWNGVERGGLLGVGQFAADAGQGNWGSLTGPTIQQLGDAVTTLRGFERPGQFGFDALPAHALYGGFVHGSTSAPDPKFPD